MNSRQSDAHLLCGGLRRRLPRDEFPAVRLFCPDVEEYEPQAARLAIDLRLDRRAARDERGVAREAPFRSLQAALLYFVFPERREASHVALVSVRPEE